jgi:Fur family peroxide stress response transcriptional regulator
MKRLQVRVTPQRIAVLDHLLNSKLHPTANEIYDAIKHHFPGMSLATVYNNLNFLCENNLARELTFSNASSRFDGDTTDHAHMICEACGGITDFHHPLLQNIDKLAAYTAPFQVAHHRLEFYGKCGECQG